MKLFRVALLMFCCGFTFTVPVLGQEKGNVQKKAPGKKEAADPNNLPITKLAPAKLIANLCLVKYAVTTRSPECQAFFDQGLGYFYSYVWMEAARSFETAAQLDPDCAMAWWGLSRAIEKWGKGQHTVALKKAQELLDKASHREQLLITARLKEKGMAAGITPENRKKEAIKTLDELLTLFDDDEEGWFYRAQVAEGPNAGVPLFIRRAVAHQSAPSRRPS